MAVDRVYRYEAIGEALRDLEERLRLPGPVDLSGIHAKSRFSRNTETLPRYSPEECRIIQTIFANEIKHLAYSRWPGDAAPPSEG